MFTVKTPSLSLGMSAALGSAMLLAMSNALPADAQSGRVKARSDRAAAMAVRGPEGGRAARARACNGIEGGTQCGSAAGVQFDDLAAGRASMSQFNEDGSFNRTGGALAISEYGDAERTLESQVNADGSGQRTVNGSALSDMGFAERSSELSRDEHGNAARTGTATASSDLGAFSTDGSGTFTPEDGLDYARDSQAAAAGDAGAFYADRSSSFDQESGFRLTNNTGVSVENENGSVQGQTDASYSLEEGYALDRSATASNAEGDTIEAGVTYNAQDGLERSAVCTNAQGETVACQN